MSKYSNNTFQPPNNGNNGGGSSSSRCRIGETRCCYSSGDFAKSHGSSRCRYIGTGSGSSNNGGGFGQTPRTEDWTQYCSENLPSSRQKRCGERNYRLGFTSVPFY